MSIQILEGASIHALSLRERSRILLSSCLSSLLENVIDLFLAVGAETEENFCGNGGVGDELVGGAERLEALLGLDGRGVSNCFFGL